MTPNKVLTNWDDTHSQLWGHAPIQLSHEMHKTPLFSREQLARLIENYPRTKTGLLPPVRVIFCLNKRSNRDHASQLMEDAEFMGFEGSTTV